MKKIITTLILWTILTASCDNLKNDTPEETAKFILESLEGNNETKIKKLLINENDSLNTSDDKLRRQIHQLYSDTSASNRYRKGYLKGFHKTYQKGKEIGVDWSDVEFLRFDFEMEDSEKKEEPESIEGKIIFNSNKTEFQLKVYEIIKFNEGWKNVQLGRFVDILKYRKELADTPYTPYGLSFTHCNWKYVASNTFKNFFVTIKNGTQDNFDNLKFKVTISIKKLGSYSEVFSRTIEQNQNIYAGDILRFEIIELRDFYVGVNISDENNFLWNAEVIDARPHPKRLEDF